MFKEEAWRLVSGVDLLIPNSRMDYVYISPLEKKQYIMQVAKLMNDTYEEIRIDEKVVFSLKLIKDSNIDSGVTFGIKSDKLPNKDIWYRVGNLYGGHVSSILESTTISLGEIKEPFEVIFSDSFEGLVSFVSPCMKEYYNDSLGEMERRLNCEIFSKTKKFKPGHRYDMLKETRYYLCPIKSRKGQVFNTDENGMVDTYIYVNRLDQEKTISEVLGTRCFGNGEYDLKVSTDNVSMVDSGEVLKDDYTGNIQDYWDSIYNKAIESSRESTVFGYKFCNNIGRVLNQFHYITKKKLEIDLEKWSRVLSAEIRSYIDFLILSNWEVPKYRDAIYISENKTLEENVSSLNTIFINSISTNDNTNIYKNSYYASFFQYFGVNIDSIISQGLVDWSASGLDITSFDNYLKYSFYFDKRQDNDSTISQQRNKSTEYKVVKNTISSLFGDSELSSVLKEIISYAVNNFGHGVESYSVINIGSLKNPKEYITCKIVLKNLVDYIGLDNMSDKLKDDIIRCKFTRITVVFDKGSKIE